MLRAPSPLSSLLILEILVGGVQIITEGFFLAGFLNGMSTRKWSQRPQACGSIRLGLQAAAAVFAPNHELVRREGREN